VRLGRSLRRSVRLIVRECIYSAAQGIHGLWKPKVRLRYCVRWNTPWSVVLEGVSSRDDERASLLRAGRRVSHATSKLGEHFFVICWRYFAQSAGSWSVWFAVVVGAFCLGSVPGARCQHSLCVLFRLKCNRCKCSGGSRTVFFWTASFIWWRCVMSCSRSCCKYITDWLTDWLIKQPTKSMT
jgi:hypothetical protein